MMQEMGSEDDFSIKFLSFSLENDSGDTRKILCFLYFSLFLFLRFLDRTAEGEDEENSFNADEASKLNNEFFKEFYSKRVLNNLKITKYEILVMIFHFAMRNRISDAATQDLLVMINTIFGYEAVPESIYKFNQIFIDTKLRSTRYLFCEKCLQRLGVKSKNEDEVIECKNCGFVNDSVGAKNFFLCLRTEDQLKDIILSNSDCFLTDSEPKNVDECSDITESPFYKEIVAANVPYRTITLTINTDGAQPFDSSQKSLWSIQSIINELPTHTRFKRQNIIISGLWFNKTQPNMSLFMAPFIDEINALYEKGFFIEIEGVVHHFKVNYFHFGPN